MDGKSENAQESDALLGEVVIGLDEILTANLQFNAGAESINVGVEAGVLTVLSELLQGFGGLQLSDGGIDLTFGGDHEQVTCRNGQGHGLSWRS